MKHFTKKLALLTLLAGLCGSAWAQVTTWTAASGTYTKGQQIKGNTEGIIVMTLGEDDAWTYDSGRGGVVTRTQQSPTLTDGVPTAGGYVILTPERTLNLKMNTYSSQSNCNVYMTDGTNKLKDFRQKAYNTNDYGTLEAGKTYYIYGGSFKAAGNATNLEYVFFCNFTATTYENYTITYKLKDGTVIKDPVTNSGLYGTSVSANSDEAVESIVYNNTIYYLTNGNEAITLTNNVNQNVINLVYEAITPGYITINYTTESGIALKEPVKVSGEDGTEYTVPAEEIPTYLTLDGVKYKYSNGNETLTFSSDEEQAIDLIYSEAEKYTYVVKAVSATEELKIIDTNEVYEGESVTVAYPQYVLSGTTLYKIANNGSGDWYRTSFTPTEDNYTKELSYTNGTVENVVFFTEAENIEGVSTANYANRASNGLVAYTQESKNLTTLEPGKYMIFIRGLNGNQATRTANFYLNDATEAVFTFGITTGTNQTGNSEEFTVAETSELSFTCEGSSSSGLDWLYIVKTGDVVSPPVTLNIGTIGYATLYYSDRALVVPAGVEAYTYTVTEGGAAYSTIYSEGEVIPKDEAVVIYKQGGGEAIFEVSSENPDKSIDNMLRGFDTAHLTEGGDIYYALSLNASGDENSIGFYWMEENGEAFESGAHKAYLALPNEGEVNVKSFYAFGNSTTAIQGIDMNASMKDAVIYNLAGQRVSAPVKGNMYIVNGKKVMMK